MLNIESLLQQLARDGSVTLTVRVRPGARRTVFKNILADGSLKIDIAAVPEDNAANEELVRFLAELFGVAPQSITLLSGATARVKVLRISR